MERASGFHFSFFLKAILFHLYPAVEELTWAGATGLGLKVLACFAFSVEEYRPVDRAF